MTVNTRVNAHPRARWRVYIGLGVDLCAFVAIAEVLGGELVVREEEVTTWAKLFGKQQRRTTSLRIYGLR
jgi:hypothetical protein